MKNKLLLTIIISLPTLLFAQFEFEKKFSNDSCQYELLISSDKTFEYFTYSTYNDMIEIDTKYAGKWELRTDSLILTDTTWPQINQNWQVSYVILLSDYRLKNLNLPDCKQNTILKLNYLNVLNENCIYFGDFNELGKFTGTKRILNDQQKTILSLKYLNGDIIDTLNF